MCTVDAVASVHDDAEMLSSRFRLDPQQLVSKVQPDSKVRTWLCRLAAGLLVGATVVVFFGWLGNWVLAIVAPAIALVAWRSDGLRLHDLLSELVSRPRAGYSVRTRPGDRITTLRAADLSAGEFICPADEFSSQMADYDRRVDAASRLARSRTARQVADQTRKMVAEVNGPPFTRSSSRAMQHVSPPVVRYRQVLAIHTERAGSLQQIGLTNAKVITCMPEAELLVFRRASAPVRKVGTETAGQALQDLLYALHRRGKPGAEQELVADLTGDRHDIAAVRRAIRAGVATHIIRRSSSFGSFLARIRRAFLGGSAGWQGEDCQLELTQTGELWLAAVADIEPQPAESAVDEKLNININTYVIGDHNSVRHNFEVRLDRDLAALQELVIALNSERQAATGEMAEALHTLEDAVACRRPYTPESRDALRFVLSKSGDVLIGVLGNTAYAGLLHLLGFLGG